MIIGLTGGIGTGKTTAAFLFKKLGFYVIDADKICHQLLNRNKEVRDRIKIYFGEKILNRNFSINKKNLTDLVFNDKFSLKQLEKIIHPFVIKRIKELSKKHQKKIIIIDAPLLFETNLDAFTDFTVVISTNKKTQIDRIIERDKISKKEILKRTANQLPLKVKIKKADWVIHNNGLKKTLRKEVFKVWKMISEKTRKSNFEN